MKKVILTEFSENDFRQIFREEIEAYFEEKEVNEAKVQKEDIVKVDEAAKIIGNKKGYIYELVHRNKIPYFKTGSRLRFSRRELEAWVKSGRPDIISEAVSNLLVNKMPCQIPAGKAK